MRLRDWRPNDIQALHGVLWVLLGLCAGGWRGALMGAVYALFCYWLSYLQDRNS